MRSRVFLSPRSLVIVPLVLLLMVAVACGGTAPAEPVVVERKSSRK